MVNHRKNGWSWPPHPFQVASLFVTVFISFVALAILAPTFASETLRLVFSCVLGALVAAVLGATAAVTSVDPADDVIRLKLRRRVQPTFDRARHAHVIASNYYCNICEEIVHPTSKHCRQCNKCVLNFDHHCKWLNNCIGMRNYRYFILYVVVVSTGSAFIAILSAVIICLSIADNGALRTENGDFLIFNTTLNVGAWVCLLCFIIFLSATTCGLTIHLLVFHVRLIKHGLTTYNFIMGERQKETQERRVHAGAGENGLDGIGASKASIKHTNGKSISNGRPTTAEAAVERERDEEAESTETPLSPTSAVAAVSSAVPFALRQRAATENAASASVVSLPPIAAQQQQHTRGKQTKIYEPHVESVFGADKELYLPSITLKSPSLSGQSSSASRSNSAPVARLNGNHVT